MREREEVAAAMRRRIHLLKAAGHALRSYQYGNAAPDLARGVADDIDRELGADDLQRSLDADAAAAARRAEFPPSGTEVSEGRR